MNTEPHSLWAKYSRLQEYLTKNEVYATVAKNEKFYDGRQWDGVKADNMPKPVINVIQRVVKYMVATLGSNNVSISLNPFSNTTDDHSRIEPIEKAVEDVIEQAKIIEASKLVIRNGAVDGTAFMLQQFNADFETNQEAKGRIENRVVDCTNVYFGNPYSADVQTQPYIMIALRQNLKQVKEEAEALGLSEDKIEEITPDNDSNQVYDDSTDLVTVLLTFYKKTSKTKKPVQSMDMAGNPITKYVDAEETTVHFVKTTKKVTLIEETDLGYFRYPISRFGWDVKKNSYLYNSPITPVIPNQVFINKCYAIAMMYGLQSAFPKVVYDRNKVDIDAFLNSTNPQAVAGIEMMGKFMDFIKVPDFSNNIIGLVQDIMQQTKECMGVNDSALGNVQPDNTSAIVALQQASATPLEIQKAGFYEFWEDTVRNIIDIMANAYGVRQVMTDEGIAIVDFDGLRGLNYELMVDIGEGAQYSEIAQINTLDKLYQLGLVNAETYIDAIPNKYIPSKGKILNALREQQAMQAQMMAQPNLAGVNGERMPAEIAEKQMQ